MRRFTLFSLLAIALLISMRDRAIAQGIQIAPIEIIYDFKAVNYPKKILVSMKKNPKGNSYKPSSIKLIDCNDKNYYIGSNVLDYFDWGDGIGDLFLKRPDYKPEACEFSNLSILITNRENSADGRRKLSFYRLQWKNGAYYILKTREDLLQ